MGCDREDEAITEDGSSTQISLSSPTNNVLILFYLCDVILILLFKFVRINAF